MKEREHCVKLLRQAIHLIGRKSGPKVHSIWIAEKYVMDVGDLLKEFLYGRKPKPRKRKLPKIVTDLNGSD